MKKTLIILIACLALLERVLFDLGPNIELITLTLILTGMYWGSRQSAIITLILMMVSDLVIGNSSIFIFTWSGFLMGVLLTKVIGLINQSGLIRRVFVGSGVGFLANIVFYFWTNFGVWALDKFNMYPDGINGLYMSYINGLPFLKMQLVSNLFIVPLGIVMFELVIKLNDFRISCKNDYKSYIINHV